MRAYYNEIDAHAAAWLRNLIAAGAIPDGDVDERSIVDVRPGDVAGYQQCHFFAGIGGWPLILALAGWPPERPCWTGSCPCQPFSVAGRRAGTADARHLWPEFGRLIGECGPAAVFGEQVASAAGLAWLAVVRADLERCGYAVGASDLPAACVGAPHIRQRLWWVAQRVENTNGAIAELVARPRARSSEAPGAGAHGQSDGRSDLGRLADASGDGSQGRLPGRADQEGQALDGQAGRGGADRRADALHPGWRDADWLYCRDGRWRPVEPGTFPLAHGVPGRVGRLRAYGNAVVPQVGAAFVRAVMGEEIDA